VPWVPAPAATVQGKSLQQLLVHLPTPLSIVVMGVSGSGKSTFGALLSRRLGCRFLEGDDFHAAASVEKMRRGVPLTDQDRWPWLDRLGSALSAAAVTDGAAVAACSALRRSYRERLRATARLPTRFIFLDNRREEIMARMRARPGHYMPPALLESQFSTLERPAPDEPAITILTDMRPEILCDQALEWLQKEPA